MPKGSVLATDTFTRANGGLGTNWTTVTGQGAPQISTNRVRSTAVGTDSRAYYNAVTWPADQYAEIQTITATATDTGRGAVVRAQSGANSFYVATHNNNFTGTARLQIHRYSAGTANLLSNVVKTIVTSDLIRMEIEGSTLRAYINDVLQYGPTTDSTYSTGSAGLSIYADSGSVANAELDNFEGGNLASAAVAPHRLAMMGVGG